MGSLHRLRLSSVFLRDSLAGISLLAAADDGERQRLVLRDPIGVVAAVVPWNGPLQMAMVKLTPALLAGNTMIVKPAPETPLDAYLLAEPAQEAGLPEAVLNILPADREVSEYLCLHPGVE